MSAPALDFKPAVHHEIEQAPFKLPEHFTAVSAQQGAFPNPASHEKLRSDLKDAGFVGLEVDGHYGYKEPSMLVIHHGTDHEKKSIEKIAFNNHKQESVLHSSNLKNTLAYSDGRKETGNGITWGDHLKSHYTELSGGHRFQLKLGEPVEKSEVRKPRHCGIQNGIHIFHALTDDHRRHLTGVHVKDPTDKDLSEAIHKAKAEKMAAVIISGAPPEKWAVKHNDLSGPALAKNTLEKEVRSPRKGHKLGQLQSLKENNWHNPDTGTEISEEEREAHIQKLQQNKADQAVKGHLKALQGGKPTKRLSPEDFFGEEPKKIAKSELAKAFLQPDGITQTDQATHTKALHALPEDLRAWGVEHLVPMKKDELATLHLGNADIHVRKLESDLYSGWALKNGEKVHSFERVTMPELMGQLQSKLEMYTAPQKDVGQKLEELKAKVSPAEDPIEAAKKFKAKLEKDFGHLLSDPSQVSIPVKDLNTETPDPECSACGSKAPMCDCFHGLSTPQIEIDMANKKVKIFFKSEWMHEMKVAFIDDFKDRIYNKLLKKREL